MFKSLWILILALSKSSEMPIRTCTGPSSSVDLLGYSLVNTPPSAIEIVKSECAKGYRLANHMAPLRVSSEEVFGTCKSISKEFSIQISFQHAAPPKQYEYLLTLLAQDQRTILFSIRYREGSIIFEYTREPDRFLDYVEFKAKNLNIVKWHDLNVAVAGNEVVMTLDCKENLTRQLVNPFDFGIDTRKTKFFIGSSNRKRKRFTGVIRKVSFVTGWDAIGDICPGSLDSTAAPVTSSCYADVQNAFETNETDKVTCSGTHYAKKKHPRMDYLIELQGIWATSATVEIETFSIEGIGHFMATANEGTKRNSKSLIYFWNGVTFEILQKVSSRGARSWKHFVIGDEHFLALANGGGDKHSDVRSPIYRWNVKRKKFARIQLLPTHNARTIAAFEIDGEHYLAIANFRNNSFNMRNMSETFIWHKEVRKFLPCHHLPSNGATDVEYIKVEIGDKKYSLLAVGNTFDGKTARLNSTIYYWKSGRFILQQQIETNGVLDIEGFTIDNDYYIAIANGFILTHNSGTTGKNFSIDSAIYKLDASRQSFKEIQRIRTNGAQDWEFFSVGSNHYLIISNFVGNSEPVRTVVYKWQGAENFVEVHNFASKPTTDIEHIEIGEDHYLTMADPEWDYIKLYKIITY